MFVTMTLLRLAASVLPNNPSGGNWSNQNGGTLTAYGSNICDDNTCGGATVATSAQINLQALADNGSPLLINNRAILREECSNGSRIGATPCLGMRAGELD